MASLSRYRVISVTLPIPSNPYVRALCLMGFINGIHFLFGLFHTGDDPRDLPAAHRDHYMHSPGDLLSIVAWIIGIVTIAPSRYLREAITCYRESRRSL